MDKRVKRYISRVFKIFLSLLLTALVLFTVYLIYCKAINRVPNVFGYSVLNVVSGSMADEIPVGARILVKKVDQSELKVRDVITFYSKDPAIYGQPNTHRIVKTVEKDGEILYITRGDANPADDSYSVAYGDIIGRYEKKLEGFSKIGWVFSNPAAYVVLIIIPAAAVFALETRNVARNAKEMKNSESGKGEPDET